MKKLGTLKNGMPFYFHPKDNDWPDDYVYHNGISLTVQHYREALSIMRYVYPSEYNNRNVSLRK